MNRRSLRPVLLPPRILLTFLWGGLCASTLAAPLLAAAGHRAAASTLYALFSRVCHQDPTRCFVLFGHSLAVCQRCSGIYLGLFLFSFLPVELSMLLDPPLRRRRWIFCAAAPMLLDVFVPFTRLWSNTPISRFATGLLFGVMLSSLLAPALAQFMGQLRCKYGKHDDDALGGLS